MKMKKLTICLLVLSLMLGQAACAAASGGENEADTTAGGTSAETAAPETGWPAEETEAEQPSAGALKPGTYEGEAQGMGDVVLACGGYEGNDELFAKYATYSEREMRGTMGKSSAAGDQGDVFTFAEQVGADIAVTGYGLAGYPETQISPVFTRMMKTGSNGHIDLTDTMSWQDSWRKTGWTAIG